MLSKQLAPCISSVTTAPARPEIFYLLELKNKLKKL